MGKIDLEKSHGPSGVYAHTVAESLTNRCVFHAKTCVLVRVKHKGLGGWPMLYWSAVGTTASTIKSFPFFGITFRQLFRIWRSW